ncbi:MAG: PEP-CTERM sorting domain-containing protein [Phycisphaerae bacterium]|nr:PEP-CTERM sorting domain-containing protein [Phycisphaerae bacterium]
MSLVKVSDLPGSGWKGWELMVSGKYGLVVFITLLFVTCLALGQNKPEPEPYGLEGPIPPPVESFLPPQPGAVILSNTPSDYDWWNGCSPTAAGMLFGFWEEDSGSSYDSFPGNHRNLPATYPGTSTNSADYTDARGVVAGWAHKQEGMNRGFSYGSYQNHVADSLGDFMLTSNGGTYRSRMAHGFETFGAWDDTRTSEIESRRFSALTKSVGSSWNYNDYCAEIDAGRPVHLGLSSTAGGHSVLGVGYNDTGGKQSVVLLTTWHWGLQEWQWENETHSGYGFSVYSGTLMEPVEDPTPQLSAYFSLAHTYISDLTVVIGTGDPDNPDWSTTVWKWGGSTADNLALTDIDCSAVLADYLNGDIEWFLKVTDGATPDVGSILDFQIRYGFDQTVTGYTGLPVAINDHQTSYVYLETVPEPASASLLLLGAVAMLRRRKK